MSTKRKSILKGAVILTAAGITTRLLGFIYRVYMSKTIGAEGMGIYQLIMPLYSLAWSICCSGITITISKYVAAENAKGEHGNTRRALRLALAVSCSLSVAIALFLSVFAEYIGAGLFNEPRTVMSLRILAAAVPFMAAGSCCRGYFSGLQEMHVPAISQVFEQVVRMAFIYTLAGMFIGRGLEYACAAAAIGIFAGETAAFLFVLYKYYSRRRKHSSADPTFQLKKPTVSKKVMLTAIIMAALPLTLNRVSGSLLGTVENILIPRSLQAFGMTAGEAVAAYGRITGMAMPLIFFPSALLYSLSSAIVPAVSESVAVGKLNRVSGTLRKTILFSIIVGIGASTIFLTFPDELGRAVYNQEIGDILFSLGLICPFWYLNIGFNGILNGLGEQSSIFRYGLVSSLINIIAVIFFVPKFGISAFIAGWLFSVVIVNILSYIKINRRMALNVEIGWILKPALSAAAAGMTTEFLSRRYLPQLGQVYSLILSASLTSVLYATFIILLGVVSISDFKRLGKSGASL